MGFHPLDMLIILGVALLIFGPKTLQSVSHTVGRGAAQAKEAKDKLLSELPMEDLAKVQTTLARIPLSPQQAAQQLVSSALRPDEKKAIAAPEAVPAPATEALPE